MERTHSYFAICWSASWPQHEMDPIEEFEPRYGLDLDKPDNARWTIDTSCVPKEDEECEPEQQLLPSS